MGWVIFYDPPQILCRNVLNKKSLLVLVENETQPKKAWIKSVCIARQKIFVDHDEIFSSRLEINPMSLHLGAYCVHGRNQGILSTIIVDFTVHTWISSRMTTVVRSGSACTIVITF